MFGSLSEFGLRALWSPVLLIVITLLAVLYILSVDQFRLQWFKQSSPVQLSKKISMLLGLTIYYIAQGGPLELLSHVTFSMHMVAMSLSYLIVPPMLLYGMPDWMLRRIFSIRGVSKVVRILTQPILTLVLFNMLFSMYHFPMVLDYVMTNYIVHDIYYGALLVSALMMWWNVVCPLPEYERITDVQKMGYIFANGVLLTPACALIVFSDSTLYATYSDPAIWAKAMGYCVPMGSDVILSMFDGPGDFAFLNPLEDQQFGGVLMKLVQEIAYGVVLFYIFLRWFRRDRQGSTIDPIVDKLQPSNP
jgi:putative membrane protein